MRRLKVTAPENSRKEVKEILEEFSKDITSTEVEKKDKEFVEFNLILEPDDIDDAVEKVRHIKEINKGELTVEIIEESAKIEKGKKMENASSRLSIQEMYSKALTFSTFDWYSWILIALSAGIAVFGVMVSNVMIVVGAMVIAPLLGPFISTSFGLVIGDKRIIRDSMINALIGVLITMFVAFIIPKPGFNEVNALMELIANPHVTTIPLSLFVGSASALTFVSGNKEQLAGVAVAIALVPPAAVSGIALSIGAFNTFLKALIIIVTNISALILAGSITFKVSGVSPSTYYRKKVSKEKFKQAVVISALSIVLVAFVVGYLTVQNFNTTSLSNEIESEINSRFSNNVISKEVEVSSHQVNVEIYAVNAEVTGSELERSLNALTDREVDVVVLNVDGEALE